MDNAIADLLGIFRTALLGTRIAHPCAVSCIEAPSGNSFRITQRHVFVTMIDAPNYLSRRALMRPQERASFGSARHMETRYGPQNGFVPFDCCRIMGGL